jgi:hypothetical protein
LKKIQCLEIWFKRDLGKILKQKTRSKELKKKFKVLKYSLRSFGKIWKVSITRPEERENTFKALKYDLRDLEEKLRTRNKI